MKEQVVRPMTLAISFTSKTLYAYLSTFKPKQKRYYTEVHMIKQLHNTTIKLKHVMPKSTPHMSCASRGPRLKAVVQSFGAIRSFFNKKNCSTAGIRAR
jgi:hypothetical protein